MRMTESMYRQRIDELVEANGGFQEEIELKDELISELEKRQEESDWCLNAMLVTMLDSGITKDELEDSGIWEVLGRLGIV